jgi:hypothetical protein
MDKRTLKMGEHGHIVQLLVLGVVTTVLYQQLQQQTFQERTSLQHQQALQQAHQQEMNGGIQMTVSFGNTFMTVQHFSG